MTKFILEVQEGKTNCSDCPFACHDCYGSTSCGDTIFDEIDCSKFDLTTIKIVKIKDE